MKSLLKIFFLFIYSATWSQNTDKLVQKGNEFYKKQQYENAAVEYNNALKILPSDNIAKFNLANSLKKQGKEEEAIKLFSEVAENSTEAIPKANAFYNLGVVLSQQKKLEESIEAYKNSLRNNPGDVEARENLQKALLELRKKNPAKKENQQQQQKKEKQQQQKKQQQPKMSEKEAEQRLKLLQQKEKEVQQRLQKEKNKGGGSQTKDW